MLIAKSAQDYYASPRSALSQLRGDEAGGRMAGAAQAARPAAAPPAERVVEGEWQKGRISEEPLFERLGRQRGAGAGRHSPSSPEAQRAINAYLQQAMVSDAQTQVRSARVDYYA